MFADLAAALALSPADEPGPSRPGRRPRLGSVAVVMADHARLLAGYLGEPAGLRDFRKHTGWYLTGFPVGGEMRRSLASVASLAELDDLLARLDPDIALPSTAVRLPRGHTDGPRPIVLPDRWLETRDDPTPPAGAELVVSGG
jgi:hypothetical protein